MSFTPLRYHWLATTSDGCGTTAAEIILEAIFWISRVEWDNKEERYEIQDVIGADRIPRVRGNNAFTNRMNCNGIWKSTLSMASYMNVPERATELEQKLQNSPQSSDRAGKNIVNNLLDSLRPINKLIEQYEGFFQLEDV